MPSFSSLHGLNRTDCASFMTTYLEQAVAYFKIFVEVYFEKEYECMRKLLACLRFSIFDSESEWCSTRRLWVTATPKQFCHLHWP